jgi:hypothetical protein
MHAWTSTACLVCVEPGVGGAFALRESGVSAVSTRLGVCASVALCTSGAKRAGYRVLSRRLPSRAGLCVHRSVQGGVDGAAAGCRGERCSCAPKHKHHIVVVWYVLVCTASAPRPVPTGKLARFGVRLAHAECSAAPWCFCHARLSRMAAAPSLPHARPDPSSDAHTHHVACVHMQRRKEADGQVTI